MVLNIESCSREEMCVSLGGSVKLLNEFRERLQDWLKLQPHLPQNVPNEILEHFIFGTKMSLEQAKQKLDMYYTMKRLLPELLTDRDPRCLTYLYKMVQIVYLPKLTPEKYRVCIMRLCVDDCSKVNALDTFKYAGMIEDILTIDTRDSGNVYVFDHSKISFSFIAKFTPTVIKKAEVALTEAAAKRIKGIHFINAAPITEKGITMLKAVLKPKIAARVHAHPRGDYESFYRHIPKSILPKDYNGDESSMDRLAEMWMQKVDEKRDWFLEQDKILVDERLRPGPALNGDNIFGFSGSFRKLDVD